MNGKPMMLLDVVSIVNNQQYIKSPAHHADYEINAKNSKIIERGNHITNIFRLKRGILPYIPNAKR